jgi:N-glycosylase/DNA lyase
MAYGRHESQLLKDIQALKKSRVRKLVATKIKEFRANRKRTSHEIFNELCFCLLTSNFNAKRSIEIQDKMGDGFLILSEKQLAKRLAELGHRYPNARANFIAEAQQHKDTLKDTIYSFKNDKDLREWLVQNVKGIGYKQASNFLKNMGYTDLAVIDFHLLDLFERYKLIKKPKTLSKRAYFEIEEMMRNISSKLNITLAELDMYLWHIETGKVLK